MRIEQIKVESFKAFKNTTIKDLPSMAVFLGAGGFQEVISRGCDVNKDFIVLEIKFRNQEKDRRRISDTGISNHYLLLQLSEEIREYAERGGQVFVSTHSPDFVNGLNVNELFFLVKEKGFTTIKAAGDDKLVAELAKENELGWLWRNHYITGANL
jgi:predicted ATPase